jgi:hypothetical protein
MPKNDWRVLAVEQGLLLSYYAGIVSIRCEDTGEMLDMWSVKAGACSALQKLAKLFYEQTEASMF